jgi:hypothetical protein
MNTEKQVYDAASWARLVADQMFLASAGNPVTRDYHITLARDCLDRLADLLGYRLEPLPTDADLAEKAKLAGEVA